MDGRHKIYHFIAISVIWTVATLTPQTVSNYRFISEFSLDLKISKNAPPLAALENELVVLSSTPQEDFVQEASQNLFAHRDLQNLKRIAQWHRESLEIQSPVILDGGARTLPGMKLEKNSPNVVLLRKTYETNNFEWAPKKKALSEAVQVVSAIKAKEDLTQDLSWQQRARLEAAQGIEQEIYDMQTDPVESFEDYAQKVILDQLEARREMAHPQEPQEVHQKASPFQLVKRDPAQEVATNPEFRFPGWILGLQPQPQGTPVRVATASSENRPSPPTPKIPKKDNLEQSPQASKEPNPFSNTSDLVASRSTPKEETSLYDQDIRQAYLSGFVEVSGGIALTGSEQLFIYHQIGGTPVAYGNILLDRGQYEIFLENPRTGILVAEVTRGDEVLGREEILIPELMKMVSHTGALKSTNINIKPLYSKIETSMVAADDPTRLIQSDLASLNGFIEVDTKKDIFSRSSVMLRSQKEGYWGQIKMGSSFEVLKQVLHSDKTIGALYSILNKHVQKTRKGVVLGKIKVRGKEVAGATVESVGIDIGNPVYFNGFLPNTDLKETSSQGEFTFVDVEPGTYALRAQYQGRFLSTQLIEVEPGFVTEVEFDVQSPQLAEVFLYDIRNSQPLPAEIGFLGAEKSQRSSSGRQLISMSGQPGVQILEAQADDPNYYNSRMTIDRHQKEVLLPLVPRDWLGHLVTQEKMSRLPQTGMVLGLAQQKAFTMELDPRAYNEETKILYFDQRGRVLHGASFAPPQGGALAVNVNEGLQGALIKYEQSPGVQAQTMFVDPAALYILNSSH